MDHRFRSCNLGHKFPLLFSGEIPIKAPLTNYLVSTWTHLMKSSPINCWTISYTVELLLLLGISPPPQLSDMGICLPIAWIHLSCTLEWWQVCQGFFLCDTASGISRMLSYPFQSSLMVNHSQFLQSLFIGLVSNPLIILGALLWTCWGDTDLS